MYTFSLETKENIFFNKKKFKLSRTIWYANNEREKCVQIKIHVVQTKRQSWKIEFLASDTTKSRRNALIINSIERN